VLAPPASHDQHGAAHPLTLAHGAVVGPAGRGPSITMVRAMSDRPQHLTRAEREAHRALLEEALADLADAPDPHRAAADVMRALDSYMEASGGGSALSPRESPVTDYDRREKTEIRWTMWIVLGGAVAATAIVAVLLSGGWPAGLAIVAIWVIALFALLST